MGMNEKQIMNISPATESFCHVDPPEGFNFSEPQAWPLWRSRFERYVRLSSLSKSTEEMKMDTFLYILGEKAEEILSQMESSPTTLKECLDMFGQHFNPRKSTLFRRAQFNRRCQKAGEPIEEFIKDLCILAETCEYGTLKEDLIRDRLIVGMTDIYTSDQMQLREKLSLKEATFIVKQAESQNPPFRHIHSEHDYEGKTVAATRHQEIKQQKFQQGTSENEENLGTICGYNGNETQNGEMAIKNIVDEDPQDEQCYPISYFIKRNEEDLELKVEDLHHSVDIKEENSNLEYQPDTEYKEETVGTLCKCEICGYKCKQKENLSAHSLSHSQEKSLSCKICVSKFTRIEQLRSHLRTHTGKGLFRCKFCDYICLYKQNLKRHLRTHANLKPHACEVCGFASAHKQSLAVHVRTHTGEKLFTCAICDFKSAHKQNLIRHMGSHTGETPFQCKICLCKFSQQEQLRNHLRSHNQEEMFRCGICDYICLYKQNLKRHLQTHATEKPFSCQFCGHTSAHKEALKAHIRLHTGEKPFKCKICGCRFRYSSQRKIHVRTHKSKN